MISLASMRRPRPLVRVRVMVRDDYGLTNVSVRTFSISIDGLILKHDIEIIVTSVDICLRMADTIYITCYM